jgi:hypothetical protein
VDLASASSLGTMLSAAVSALKDARDLAKASSDHALKEKISDVYDHLIDLKAVLHAKDDEIRTLKEELARKSACRGPLPPHNYFYKGTDNDNPLCPKCMQQERSIESYLSPLRNWNGGKRRVCGICHWIHYEEPTKPTPIRVR